MEVTVIPFNEVEVVDKIYTACRTCYAEGTPQEQYDKTQCELTGATGWEKKWKLINHVISSGHTSTVEHTQFTFLISGASRALSHQLVRHRIGVSYSQQSQRYCEFKQGFQYVTPESIKKTSEIRDKYIDTMSTINQAYLDLIELGIPAEDARMVLPNACCTNLTVSINLRALIHLCQERLCTNAQWEIRSMVRQMAKLITDKIPELKPYLVPKCKALGYCNESASRTCGCMPLKEHALQNVYISPEE